MYIVKCSIYSGGSKISGSGSTTTKPVPAPRRGGKPGKSRGLRIYEWMDKLGKCVCCVYQKRRNVTKVGRPTEKPNFCCPRGRRISGENLPPQEFALCAEQKLATSPVNPGIFEAQHQTNCNRIVFNAI